MKRFVVIGLGNFGASAAEALHAKGHEVIAVDPREEAVDRIAPFVTRAVVADGRSVEALERVGARNADVGIVSTGDDITASILATLALRDLGVKDVYVKVVSRDHARVMERVGATETIFPERDTALELASRLSGAAILNYVRLAAGFSLQEMAVRDEWVGKSLRELELPRRYGITVIAMHDVLHDKIVSTPDPDTVLKGSETLLVAGRDEDLARAAGEK
ncbi:MAG: TrkA family potassium uptake protein [Gemmataceae bacterium]|nr:TrkA family potassium uptake protein [Gemmataceae bacterium]MCS7271064.1 TrkA family potassium uptake protein [Gemmataceae bacterium]MDW8241909.1 TrkA family potassium uptake protein [Thermogemmata sp.]